MYSFTYYLAGSIFASDLLSVFIYKLTGSSEDVGNISGSRGIATVIFAFPVAYFADRFRRDRILKVGSIVGFVTLSCTVYVFTQLKPGVKNIPFAIGVLKLTLDKILPSNTSITTK